MTDQNDLFNAYQRHYSSGSDQHFIDPVLAESLHKDRYPRWMKALPRNIRILDAGCADGYQLSILRHAGFHNLAGVDISSEMSALARQRLGEDIPITTSPIDTFLRGTDTEYDVILFHHVIEHVPRDQTLTLLRLFHQRLASPGYLSIRTPNANALVAGHDCFGDFTHIVAFNEKSLIQVLEGAGFSPDKITVISSAPTLFWSPMHPIRMVLRLLNRLRSQVNHWLHRVVYLLGDVRPHPKSFDRELQILAHK